MHPPAYVITLRRATERFKQCQEHYQSVGVKAETFYGLDYQITGLKTEHKYEVDHPGSGYVMGGKQVSLHLSHYMLWQMLAYQPGDAFWVLEDDCQWDQNWKQQFDDAQSVLPADWDMVWLGSCCCADKPQYNVGKNLFVVQFPMCTHAYMIRKKALPIILESCQKVWAPVDIALIHEVMHKLKVFTILPRLCGQWNTLIAP